MSARIPEPLRVFVGYDPKEAAAYRVCVESLRDHASTPVAVTKLGLDWLRKIGCYRRHHYVEDGQRCDSIDDRPFSTDFSFSRFLVPALAGDGLALFCDSDFLWRDDVALLFAGVRGSKACWVVKHDHQPPERTKMRGQAQSRYARKNWSSLVLWNASHGANRLFATPFRANHEPGWWLHGFTWLEDDEIGELPPEWNWLEGASDPALEPRAVHFTRGTPDMPGHEDVPFADEWRAYEKQTRAG